MKAEISINLSHIIILSSLNWTLRGKSQQQNADAKDGLLLNHLTKGMEMGWTHRPKEKKVKEEEEEDEREGGGRGGG